MSRITRWRKGAHEVSLVVSERGGASIIVYHGATIATSLSYDTGKEFKAERDAAAIAAVGGLQRVQSGAEYAAAARA